MSGLGKILLTGATGFIGSAVARELVKRDHPYVAAVRNPDPPQKHGVSVAVGEINSDTEWQNALQNIDCIIHCAARVHVMDDSSNDPEQAYFETNTYGTLALAKAAADAGVRRFIFLSTAKVNGESTANRKPFSADDIPDPQDPYSRSKAEAEKGLRRIGRENRMQIVIIRPPLVYGPGVKANFEQMMRWLSKGIPLPLASCRNKRAMVHRENLVNLILHVVAHPSAPQQIFMVRDALELSIPELLRGLAQGIDKPAHVFPCPVNLLRALGRMTGLSAQIERLSQPLQVDLSKTMDMLDWTPLVEVKLGLAETMKHYEASRR